MEGWFCIGTDKYFALLSEGQVHITTRMKIELVNYSDVNVTICFPPNI